MTVCTEIEFCGNFQKLLFYFLLRVRDIMVKVGQRQHITIKTMSVYETSKIKICSFLIECANKLCRIIVIFQQPQLQNLMVEMYAVVQIMHVVLKVQMISEQLK